MIKMFELKKPKPISSGHCQCDYEVSEEAIEYYQKYYSIYNENEYSKGQRKQMSTPGDCLIKKEKTNASINIVADILTSIDHIKKNEQCDNNKLLIFENIYQGYGNFLPCAEGINTIWNKKDEEYPNYTDFYFYKLKKIKNILVNKDIGNEIDIVRNRIVNNQTLGRGILNFGCLKYWLLNEYIKKNRNWEFFVNINFLNDYVDNNYDILKPSKNIDEYLEFLIDRIIMRQYRIENNEEMPKEHLKFFKEELERKL